MGKLFLWLTKELLGRMGISFSESVACLKCILLPNDREAIPGEGRNEQIRHNSNEADTCSGDSFCCKVTVLEGFISLANQHTYFVVCRRPVETGCKTNTRSLHVDFLLLFLNYMHPRMFDYAMKIAKAQVLKVVLNYFHTTNDSHWGIIMTKTYYQC